MNSLRTTPLWSSLPNLIITCAQSYLLTDNDHTTPRPALNNLQWDYITVVWIIFCLKVRRLGNVDKMMKQSQRTSQSTSFYNQLQICRLKSWEQDTYDKLQLLVERWYASLAGESWYASCTILWNMSFRVPHCSCIKVVIVQKFCFWRSRT